MAVQITPSLGVGLHGAGVAAGSPHGTNGTDPVHGSANAAVASTPSPTSTADGMKAGTAR